MKKEANHWSIRPDISRRGFMRQSAATVGGFGLLANISTHGSEEGAQSPPTLFDQGLPGLECKGLKTEPGGGASRTVVPRLFGDVYGPRLRQQNHPNHC